MISRICTQGDGYWCPQVGHRLMEWDVVDQRYGES